MSLFFAKQEGTQTPGITTQTDEEALTSFRRRSSRSSAAPAANDGSGGGGSRRFRAGRDDSSSGNGNNRAIMMTRVSHIEGDGEGQDRNKGGESSNNNNINNDSIEQQQHGNTTPSSREVDKVEKKIKDKEDTEAVDETMAGSESSRMHGSPVDELRRNRRRVNSGIYVRTDYEVTVEEGRSNSNMNGRSSENGWHTP